MKQKEKEDKNFNKKFISELEVTTKTKNDIYDLKYPICIITYGNRKPSILDNLEQFGKTAIKVFIYDFQKEMYNWLSGDNIEKIYVDSQYLTVQKMRVFVQNYMGEKKYWVCDDDVCGVLLYPKKHEIKLAHGLKMLENATEGRNFSALGFCSTEMATYFWDGSHIFSGGFPRICVLYDGKVCLENGLVYTGDSGINEDLEFVINSHLLAIPVEKCDWGYLKTYCADFNKSIASTKSKHLSYQMNAYIKYGSWVRIAKSASQILSTKIRYGQIGKEKVYDDKLLEMCKNSDFEQIIDYIKKK